MRRYALGFMLDSTMSSVLLIRKRRPSWQAGRLNGIGGSTEPGETPFQAMIREFGEETGVRHEAWIRFQTLAFPEAEVVCFAAHSDAALKLARTVTDEPILHVAVNAIPDDPVMDLARLVPLAIRAADRDRRCVSIRPWPMIDPHAGK